MREGKKSNLICQAEDLDVELNESNINALTYFYYC